MNVSYDKAKAQIIITVPFTEAGLSTAPLSKSGKSRMIASTSGFTGVTGAPNGVKLSLNVIGPV